MDSDEDLSNDVAEEENEDSEEKEESDNSDDSDEEEDKELAGKIAQLKDTLLTNPFSYDDHVTLISILRTSGDLVSLREARENFAKRFPLSPQLWLEWLSDEQKLASTLEEKQFVIQLFERAVEDYVSVDVWLEYCQFMMSMMELDGGIDKVREVVSRSISYVGRDASKGSMIWTFSIEFEKALLTMMTDEAEKKTQVEKIYDIYRRFLSIPMLNMDSIFQEFTEWFEEAKLVCPDLTGIDVKQHYERAKEKLEAITPFEEGLLSSKDSDRIEQYRRYLEYAEKKLDPATTQCLHGRAITDHCLEVSLWINYIDFLETKLKVIDAARSTFERATKNCPWSSTLWISYLRSLERNEVPRNEVVAIFEKALQAGLPSGYDFLQLWTAYLDYTRRVTNTQDEEDVERLRRTFAMAADHLAGIPDADANFTILQYSAKVEASMLNSIEAAREIWTNITSQEFLSSQAAIWVEYFNLERIHGDHETARNVLLTGLKACWDWPETLGEMLIKFDREEGKSLKEFEESSSKYALTMKRVNKRREGAKKSQENEKAQKQSKPDLKNRKRSAQDGPFKTPEIPTNPKRKKEDVEKKDVPATPHFVKPKESKDPINDLNSVFVSNLDFSVDDEQLKNVFSQFGQVKDVRLVRNYKGLSKGFCYVEFEDIEGARRALKNDRMPLGERPMFISEIGKKADFKFSSSMEKNKLFVSNIDPAITKDQLRSVFEKHGQVKDVRIVTYRNGHSKGIGYIEFTDELGANNGLKADGLLMGEKEIKVEISNPQRAGSKKSQPPPKTLGSSTFYGESGRKRINVPMIPTSVRRQNLKNGKS